MDRDDGRNAVLVAGPNAVLGLELHDALAAAGFRIVGPLGRRVDAEAVLHGALPDFAILGLDLKDGRCDNLAHALSRRGVPLVIHADRPPVALAAALAGAPWLAEPVCAADVVSLLGQWAHGRGTP